MQKTNETSKTEPMLVGNASSKAWQSRVSTLLSQAASLCVEHGVDVETFLKDAWTSYVEARPGLRDYLEEA